jgi:Type I phosphodiesterase / nucleotide pyrophosphatase
MSLDDLFLALQRGLDRLVRRLRLGSPPPPGRSRLLIVQIDGLSRSVLEQGMAEGYAPFLRSLHTHHGHRVRPMTVGMPTSTPAFQMAAMYGVRPDIPGFHYHDKRRRTDVHFPRVGHAARVESEQAAGRRGILQDGSAYGCVFTGGAANNFYNFARLTRPTGDGLVRVLSAFIVLAYVFVKSLLRTVLELVRVLLGVIANPVGGTRRGWRWLAIKIGVSIWVRELFTLSTSRDLYAGVPAVYVNYLDYDVAAHTFGPRSRRALRSLRRVDRSIHQLWRVLRRVPEHRYDLYVLSDHGQAECRAYRSVAGGAAIERQLFDEFLDRDHAGGPHGERAASPPRLRGHLRAYRQGEQALFQRFVNYLEEDLLGESSAYERDGIRIISAGPNAFLYMLEVPEPVTIEVLERRFPGLGEQISRSPGIGFVLARSESGPVCFWRGQRFQLGPKEPGPFRGRPDADVVMHGILDLMAMPSAGDLVLYGIDAPGGHVSFIPEVGAHAGPSPEELHTFIVVPPAATMPTAIEHPIDLYPYFLAYQEGP